MERPTLHVGRRIGATFEAGPYRCTPEAFVVRFQWLTIGYVWNWPLALNVTHAGRNERARVVDVTQLLVWGLWLLAFAMGLSGALMSMRTALKAKTTRSNHSE